LDSSSGQILKIEGLSASYGGPDVIRDISIEVRPHEVVGVLGPNGAGKSTLLNAISGVIKVTSGRTVLMGEPIHGLPVHTIVARGVAQVPQGRRLFPYSTGYENLRAGAYVRVDRDQIHSDIVRFGKDWPVAQRVMNRKGVLMSGGEQQVIALGRGIMSRPHVLLLDEPSLGLAPILVDQLFEMIRTVTTRLNDRGSGVLLVEQNVRKTLSIANWIYVLVNGRITHSGPASELTPQDVVGLYLGKRIQEGDRTR
jgi:branched-chain amino acid transport system ATP-binding protein